MTDDKTPDPTDPALLSAARLAEIRERHTLLATAIAIDRDLTPDEEVEAEQDLGDLLSHLDALTPRAADGEAGRRLYYALHPTAHERAWESHDADLRARHEAQVATLVAAGRSEGEAERVRLADEVANLRLVCSWDPMNPLDLAEARATIARLTAELAAQQEQHVADLSRAVEQLTRHDADEAARIKSLDRLRGHLDLDMFATVDDCADEGGRLASEVERLTAELAEARALHEAVIEQKIAAHAEEIRLLAKRDAEAIEQARLDGAREEREACALTLESLDVRPEELEAIRDGAAAIRTRGEGQGS